MRAHADLSGKRILLVEDDALIGADLAGELTQLGATVTLTGRLTEAIALAEGAVDHAVLDVKLEDGNAHPVADRLLARGVPVTFHSATTRCAGLAARFPGAAVLRKPALPQELAATIRRTGGAAFETGEDA